MNDDVFQGIDLAAGADFSVGSLAHIKDGKIFPMEIIPSPWAPKDVVFAISKESVAALQFKDTMKLSVKLEELHYANWLKMLHEASAKAAETGIPIVFAQQKQTDDPHNRWW